MKLSHNLLIDIAKELNYKNIGKGLCLGYSLMWSQAVCIEEEKAFYNRLALIEECEDIGQLMAKINVAKALTKAGKSLSPKDRDYLEILAFFDGLILYQRPDIFSELFADYVPQNKMDKIFPFASSQKLDEFDSPLTCLWETTHIFTLRELTLYLELMSRILPSNAALIFNSGKHAVACKYDSVQNHWSYADINDLLFSSESFTVQVPVDEIAYYLFFSFEDQDYTAFRLSVLHAGIDLELWLNLNTTDWIFAKNKKQIERYTNRGIGLLYLACYNGDSRLVASLLEQKNILVNQSSSFGVTPLMMACQNGYEEVVKLLLDVKSININSVSKSGKTVMETVEKTALHYACVSGNEKISRLLLDKNIDVNGGGNDGFNTPLHFAGVRGHKNIVKLLLKQKGIKFDRVTVLVLMGDMLLDACQTGDVEFIDLLIKHKIIPINCVNNEGKTALSLSCERGFYNITEKIIQYGKFHQLNSCAVEKFVKIKNILINNPELLTKGFGFTGLHSRLFYDELFYLRVSELYRAYNSGDIDTVKVLLKLQNKLINIPTTQGNTLLHLACQDGDQEAVKLLLGYLTVDVNCLNHVKEAPLHRAIEMGHFEIAKLLLAYPSIVTNSKNTRGKTALHLACDKGNCEVIKILFERGIAHQLNSLDDSSMDELSQVLSENPALLNKEIEFTGLNAKENNAILLKLRRKDLREAYLNYNMQKVSDLLSNQHVAIDTFIVDVIKLSNLDIKDIDQQAKIVFSLDGVIGLIQHPQHLLTLLSAIGIGNGDDKGSNNFLSEFRYRQLYHHKFFKSKIGYRETNDSEVVARKIFCRAQELLAEKDYKINLEEIAVYQKIFDRQIQRNQPDKREALEAFHEKKGEFLLGPNKRFF